MTAEHYVQEKERLSQALHSQDRLTQAVSDIMGTLEKYNLDCMPHLAFDVVQFALETRHLEDFSLPGRQ